jgi:hypothetical protein
MNPSRPCGDPKTRRKLDHVSRAAAPFPLNGSAARSATPNSRPRILSQSISLSLPLGSLLVVGRKAGATVFTRARISLRSELAGDPAEDCAESLGLIASIIGVRHAQQHEVSDVRQAEQAYPKPGEVCRERG